MPLTDDHRDRLENIARRHGFSPEAAGSLLDALAKGHGTQAQFNHPELGGFGQWSGGMLMIGDMFNADLKARVAGLIRDLSDMARDLPDAAKGGGENGTGDDGGWPSGLGTPSATGAQGDMRYAVFPETRRLAVMRDGRVSVYDTGDHRISGVSQQQGGATSLRFASQHGPVALESLTPVTAPQARARPEPEDDAPQDDAPQEPPTKAAGADGTVLALIEQLHALLGRGVLTQAEYDAKKAELLARL